MRGTLCFALALIAALIAATGAWAAVLDFEGLWPGHDTAGTLPADYGGFTWSTAGWITKDLAPGSGYQNTIEGHVGIYTWLEGEIALSGEPFTVSTIKIGAGWNDNQFCWVRGYSGPTVVYEVYTVVSYDGQTLDVNFESIDKLTIAPDLTTGTPHTPGQPSRHHIVVDNIAIEPAAPPAPPVADAGPDQTVEQATHSGTQVTLDGGASTGAEPLTYEWSEGATSLGTGEVITPVLQLGVHVITLEVTDANGLTDSDECVVTVQDTTPPTLTLTILKPVLWPPNHQLILAATVSEVSDACDSDPSVAISVAGSEPIDGDWLVAESDDVWGIWLRAERAAPSCARTYTITATATDDSGNSSQMTGTVTVPHDQRGK